MSWASERARGGAPHGTQRSGPRHGKIRAGADAVRRTTRARGRLRSLAAATCLLAAAGGCVGNHAGHAPEGRGLADLPLVEVAARRPGHALAVMLSGDGDWAEIDRGVAATLADSGVAVIGLRSRTYLQRGRRTPSGLADDVARVLRHYMPAWQRDTILIVGYSRGADFAPMVANRLPPELRGRLALVVMLAMAPHASFEFHWLDLVRDTRRPSDIPTLPEVARLRGVHMLCVYGREEPGSACPGLDTAAVRTVERGGGHHFDGDYQAIGALIVDALRRW